MNNIYIKYYEDIDQRWDAYIEGARHICVNSAKDLCQARTFIRMLFEEEIGPCKIVQETFKYYEGI